MDLQRLTALLLADVRAVCVRPDCADLARIIDVPNLHRLAEVAVPTVTWCGHIRDTLELAQESAHQPLKQAIKSGNGRDDGARAMTDMVDREILSRIAAEPSDFGIPAHWLSHRSMQKLLAQAEPLWSAPPNGWRVASEVRLTAAVVPAPVRAAVQNYVPDDTALQWHGRINRGKEEDANIGAAVAVLVESNTGVSAVHVAEPGREDLPGVHVRFFVVFGI